MRENRNGLVAKVLKTHAHVGNIGPGIADGAELPVENCERAAWICKPSANKKEAVGARGRLACMLTRGRCQHGPIQCCGCQSHRAQCTQAHWSRQRLLRPRGPGVREVGAFERRKSWTHRVRLPQTAATIALFGVSEKLLGTQSPQDLGQC